MNKRIWIILSLISLMSISCCADSLGILNESSTTKDGITTREFTLIMDNATEWTPISPEETKPLLDAIDKASTPKIIETVSINPTPPKEDVPAVPLHPIKAPSITFILFTIVCLIIIHEISEYRPNKD